jgi:predicted component of type VI protein secretion system
LNGLVFVEQKPMEGREVEATADAVIGREGTDIVLADPEVSRRHAAIRVTGVGVAIEDLGSTNGTYVNNERIQGTRELKEGDEIRFGNTVWRLQGVAAANGGATRVGQVAAPQVTAARAVPTDIEPPAQAEPPAPPAPPAAPEPVAAPQPVAAAAPQAPAQPAAPTAAQVGPRGDVPPPPEVAPSAIRRVLPAPGPGQQAPAFSPPGGRRITSKTGSAATRIEATIICWLIVLAVAAALCIYFAAQ